MLIAGNMSVGLYGKQAVIEYPLFFETPANSILNNSFLFRLLSESFPIFVGSCKYFVSAHYAT